MSKKETKVFDFNLIGDSVSVSLENLFFACETHVKTKSLSAALNPKVVSGHRQPAKSSKSGIEKQTRLLNQAKHRRHRACRVAMLYSVIGLEHVVFEALCRLQRASDQDFLSKEGKKFWRRNPQTGLVQITDLGKAAYYLLGRNEVQAGDCNCKLHAGASVVHAYLKQGLVLRNGFVHGVSGQKTLDLHPVGEPKVVFEEGDKRTEEQQFHGITRSQSKTSFSEAVVELKSAGVFVCSHADGDPNHVCVSMATSFCRQGFDLTRVIAKHYEIAVSAIFYDLCGSRILATNQKPNERDNIADERIVFSGDEIVKRVNRALKG